MARRAPSPEVFYIGTLESASDFPLEARGLQCKWEILHGDSYEVLEGNVAGLTHLHVLEHNTKQISNMAILNHTIDAHLAAIELAGPAPKLKITMYMLNSSRRLELVGYGCCALPLVPGAHHVAVHCWRPLGTFFERLTTQFLGRYPSLADTSLVIADKNRFGLACESSGVVHVTLNCLR
ncbi:B9 domain-containing protein [Pelagophyceae sp. CCMP2097]|nr:B9 domain-containing protein [Pelagophyceae sp. CCMP2097]